MALATKPTSYAKRKLIFLIYVIFVKSKRFELTPHERIQASFHSQITCINKNTKHENTYMMLRRNKRFNFTKMNLLAPLRM